MISGIFYAASIRVDVNNMILGVVDDMSFAIFDSSDEPASAHFAVREVPGIR